MPVTVKFDPNVTSPQAFVIPNATPRNDGVMTKEQAAILAGLSGQVAPSGAILIYVRNSGSDATGDGTLAKPFATIPKALSVIPLIKIGPNFIINLDGYTVNDPNIVFPPFVSSMDLVDTTGTGRHPAFLSEGYVTLSALPTTIETLNPATTVYSVDPVTGLLIIQDTSKAWTVNEWQGRLLEGDGFFQTGRVISNTADTLITTAFLSSFTGAVKIQTPSCVLNQATPFKYVAKLLGVHAPIVFQGISMPRNGGPQRVADMQANDYVEFEACDYGGLFITSGAEVHDIAGYCQSDGSTITSAVFECQSVNMLLTMHQGVGAQWECRISADGVAFVGCFTFAGHIAGEVVQAVFDGGNGVIVMDGSALALFGVKSSNAVGANHINQEGNGIFIEGGGIVNFSEGNIGGNGNAGVGVRAVAQGCGYLEPGEPVNFTITGAGGDLKVGDNAVRTWADFNANPPVLSETDAINHLARVGVGA